MSWQSVTESPRISLHNARTLECQQMRQPSNLSELGMWANFVYFQKHMGDTFRFCLNNFRSPFLRFDFDFNLTLLRRSGLFSAQHKNTINKFDKPMRKRSITEISCTMLWANNDLKWSKHEVLDKKTAIAVFQMENHETMLTHVHRVYC